MRSDEKRLGAHRDARLHHPRPSARGRRTPGAPRPRARRRAPSASRASCSGGRCCRRRSPSRSRRARRPRATSRRGSSRLRTPFIAAFMPEVPHASSGRIGLLSQTSVPRVRSRAERHVVVGHEARRPADERRAIATSVADDAPARRRRRDAPCRRTRAARCVAAAGARAASGRGRSGRCACSAAARRAKPIVSDVGVEPRAGARADLVEQLALERLVRRPERRPASAAASRMRASCHVGAWTPFVIAMISARARRRRCHIARDDLAVELATPRSRAATGGGRRPSC